MQKLSQRDLQERSIADHFYGFEATGSELQVVCSCGWRSRVWRGGSIVDARSTFDVNRDWLDHVAGFIKYKVVVTPEPGAIEAESNYTWLLMKLTEPQSDGVWELCRRDDPADALAFEAARSGRWGDMRPGEYALEVRG